jgi:hybrid cluster-associated redox disulfide protein
MRKLANISRKTTVKELLERYPQVLTIFIELKLKCFGCPMEGLHTLEDISIQNRIDVEQLLINFNSKIDGVEMASGKNTHNTLTSHVPE